MTVFLIFMSGNVELGLENLPTMDPFLLLSYARVASRALIAMSLTALIVNLNKPAYFLSFLFLNSLMSSSFEPKFVDRTP